MVNFPEGRYSMVNASVRESYGGATRSQLLRARLFSKQAHQPVDVITFDVYPEYDSERRLLTDAGLICPGVRLLNLHEELASAQNIEDYHTRTGAQIPAWYHSLNDMSFVVEYTSDGRPWRKKYDPTGTNRSFFFSYLRADGSVYATVDRRIGGTDWDRNERGTVVVDLNGVPIGYYPKKSNLIGRWLKTMGVNFQNHFLIFDSKESGYLIAEEEREANQHFILLAHTPHLQPPRKWDSPSASLDWSETMKGLSLWDGFVVLSEAHKADISMRYGNRNNVFVIPHPAVDIVSATELPDRDPDLALIVCRLEHQKRLQDAIRAFAVVLENRPKSKLEIYGTGAKMEEWSRLADELNISESVKFMGYDPRPERQYLRASVFIMTSLFEAQPLTLLEAIAHGCPIASYDIKYGPAEMVQQGTNGFLCEEGNIDALADNILKILDSDITKMSVASIDVAHDFSVPVFLDRWESLFWKVVDQKSQRIQALSSSLSVLGITTRHAQSSSIAFEAGQIRGEFYATEFEMNGRLLVTADKIPLADTADLQFGVRIHTRDSAVIHLPSEITNHSPGVFLVSWRLQDSAMSLQNVEKCLHYEVTLRNEHRMEAIDLEGTSAQAPAVDVKVLTGATT